MFVGVLSLFVLWIVFGASTLSFYANIASADSNPLWYGLVFIFWPIAIVVGLGIVVVGWLIEVRAYYKKKGEKDE